MAAGIDRARLQGNILSGKSVTVNLYGAGSYDGVFKSGYGAKRERKAVPGSRKDLLPIGVTAGEFTPGMISLAVSETTQQLIREGLAALEPNGKSYGDAIFTCTIGLSEANAAGPPILYTFRTCWWAEDKGDFPISGIEELKAEVNIGYLQPDANGLTLWSSQQ